MSDAKHDNGKNRLELLPSFALQQVGLVLTFGANKYAPESWRSLENARLRYTGALLRHLLAWMTGETHDSESGLHHLSHVACNAMFLVEIVVKDQDK